MSFIVVSESNALAARASEFAHAHGFQFCFETEIQGTEDFLLHFGDDGISLVDCKHEKPVTIRVDFVKGANAHRRLYGGGKGQAIAKAIGLSKGVKPFVLDATAGLGGDAFVLATLGCKVEMNERNPIVWQLLSDGLERARNFACERDPELLEVINRMHLVQTDSLGLLRSTKKYDVVYLDPMFPESGKTAKVKKGMQAFHRLIGKDEDADKLLEPALGVAEYRVVVKRPRIAPFLAGRKPGLQFEGKSSRFDIYTIKKMA